MSNTAKTTATDAEPAEQPKLWDLKKAGHIDEEDTSSKETKFIGLKKFWFTDAMGEKKPWDVAIRKTRGKSGVDAVAIASIIRQANKPVSTIIIRQYRAPAKAICVEFPAGLVENDDTVKDTAHKELEEETGYKGEVTDISPIIVSDPGMSSANMQLATVELEIQKGQKPPKPKLQGGEYIEQDIVPLNELYDKLVKYSSEGMKVDARLWHWAAGFNAAINVAKTML